MNWIGSLLETTANSVTNQIAGWHWETDGIEGDTTMYQLVVLGSRDRRAIKVFTTDELDRCLYDETLQSEISARLTRIVTFLDGRANATAKKRQ